MKPLFRTLPLALLFAVGLVAGCGDSGGPDPKVEKTRMNSAVGMRALFDKAGGDYEKLDATDKAAFEKFAGKDAQATWNAMRNGPGGGPSTGPTP